MTAVTDASKEPRSFKRGDYYRRLFSYYLDELQRSHVHLNVVTPQESHVIEGRYASKEPRSFKRGDIDGEKLGAKSPVASKEPRSFKRGDITDPITFSVEGELQRSHVHLNVVTRHRTRTYALTRVLQRSHVHLNVVTARRRRHMTKTYSFKGATFI